MSCKYSCIKNKFTKRSIYIELLKTPTEKKSTIFIQKETSKCVTNSKIRSPKKDFSKLIRELYKKLIIHFRHGFQTQIVNTV